MLTLRRTFRDKEVNTPATPEENHQEPFPGSMTAIAAGIILAVIGSIIGSNWARDTMINYAGFGMLLSGIAIFILGLFGTATTTLRNFLEQKGAAAGIRISKPKLLFR